MQKEKYQKNHNMQKEEESRKEIGEIVNKKFKDLVEKIKNIQFRVTDKSLKNGKLEKLIEDAQKAFEDLADSFKEKKNLFKEMIRRKADLKKWKISILKSFFPVKWGFLLSMPIIYGFSVILFIFHLALEIYHQICFRLFNIPLVKSQEYFIFDRQKLPYLNIFEKLNCIYCSYANNLMRYSTEIIGRTERFWCPIKHAKNISQTHSQYSKFISCLDAQGYRENAKKLRNFSDVVEMEKRKYDISLKK